jgi:hypothetical protein
MKFVLILIIGLAGGYYLGYQDATAGNPSVMARIVGKVGGRSRGSVGNDVDAQMKSAEDTSRTASKQSLDKRDKISP